MDAVVQALHADAERLVPPLTSALTALSQLVVTGPGEIGVPSRLPTTTLVKWPLPSAMIVPTSM